MEKMLAALPPARPYPVTIQGTVRQLALCRPTRCPVARRRPRCPLRRAPTRPRRRACRPTAPSPDPRVGLRAGLCDAGEAVWNLKVLSKTPPSEKFVGDHQLRPQPSPASTPSRAATTATRSGTSRTRASRALETAYVCPASQSDVSVYKNLLFVSGEGSRRGSTAATEGVQGHGELGAAPRPPDLRHHRHRPPEERRQRADLPRLAHPHGAGGSQGHRQRLRLHLRLCRVRSPSELPGCVERDAVRPIPTRRSSASRSSRCRSRTPSRRRSSARRGSSTT